MPCLPRNQPFRSLRMEPNRTIETTKGLRYHICSRPHFLQYILYSLFQFDQVHKRRFVSDQFRKNQDRRLYMGMLQIGNRTGEPVGIAG